MQVGLEAGQVGRELDLAPAGLQRSPPLDIAPLLDRGSAVRCSGDAVLQGRIGLQTPAGRVEAVEIDAGDQRALLIEDRLALDDRGQPDGLVDGHRLAIELAPRDLGPDRGRQADSERIKQLFDHLACVGIGVDPVGIRIEVALEGAVGGQPLEEVVFREQVERRGLGQRHELVDVHGQLGGGQVGRDLLQAPPLADSDRDLHAGLLPQRGHDLRWRQGRRQVVDTRLQVPRASGALDRVLEGELAAHHAALEEQVADVAVSGALLDDDRDAGPGGSLRHIRQRIGLIPEHKVADQPVVDRAGMRVDPRHQLGRKGQKADEDGPCRRSHHGPEPDEQEQRLEPSTTAWRHSTLLAQGTDPRVAELVLLMASGRTTGHLAS